MMTPKKTPREGLRDFDMFRMQLDNMINLGHPLARLARDIPWAEFDEAFEPLYCPDMGRPGIPTRLMVGLHYLKHAYDLSDEEVVRRWVENPYWQYFCGMTHFEHEVPIDPSTMTRWRRKIEEAGAEKLLQGTIKAGLKSGVIKPRSFEKLNADTTVQEKAITHPTDAKLYQRMREHLVRLAREHGIKLRQSYERVGKKSVMMASRYSHARQMKRAGREVKKLKNYLGRVSRDIERKIVGDAELEEIFAQPLEMAQRLFEQKRDDKGKLYSIHAPEVECISKGKAHKKYEFGVKVGVVTTSVDNFVVGMKAFHGNPYDGHTLSKSLEQAERIAGRKLDGEVFVDRGYRGHDYAGAAKVHIVNRVRRSVRTALEKYKRRRSAVEPVIGHMKSDGRLGRNWLKGVEGDGVNAILAGCGQNIRKLLREFSFLLALACGKLAAARLRSVVWMPGIIPQPILFLVSAADSAAAA